MEYGTSLFMFENLNKMFNFFTTMTSIEKDPAVVLHIDGVRLLAKFRRRTSHRFRGDSAHTLKATLNYYIHNTTEKFITYSK